jgi:diguanylate cyclase (GGDEF)-like protein
MRAANIQERAQIGFAVTPPSAFFVGGVAAAVLIAVLGVFWPAVAVDAALVFLFVFGCLAAALRREGRELADHDPLTGVASRTFFAAALRRAVAERSPADGSVADGSVSVAVLDCDGFKQINERFGHAVGDSVLIEVASVLAQLVGEAGTVGRLWGDAFGIVFPKLSEESAHGLLAEAQQCLQLRMSVHDWPLTFSIGISSAGGSITTGEDLLGDADRLMFAVKRRGRNGIASRGQFPETNAATGQPRDPLASPEFARQP